MDVLRSILFLVAITSLCLLQHAVADEALIRRVCAATPEEDACLICLLSAVGSQSKDQIELAAMSINCASSISDTVIQDLGNMQKGNGAIKACNNAIHDAKASLANAMLDWSNSQYGSDADKVTPAIDGYSNNCSQLPRNIPSLPSVFLNDLDYLRKTYYNARNILHNLSNKS